MMIGMTVKFDEEKILREGIYDVSTLSAAVDKIAKNNHLKQLQEGKYIGTMKEYDFAMVGRTILTLKDQDWFMDNIKDWLYHKNGLTEDVAAHYREKKHGQSRECQSIN